MTLLKISTLALMISLAGCASLDSGLTKAGDWVGKTATKVGTTIGLINKQTVADLLAINTALAKSAPSVGVIAADLEVAYGYFQAIAGKGLLSPAAQRIVDASMLVVDQLAEHPPASITEAALALAAIKTNIQNLSTVPNGSQAVAIPVVAVPATSVTAGSPATTIIVPAQ